MWPFRRSRVSRPRNAMRRIVAGLVIGGAVGSIVGSHMLEKVKKEEEDGNDKDDSNAEVDEEKEDA